MANSALSTSSIYSHRLHESEPLKFFIQLMDLKAYEKELAAEPNALEILSGLVLYRHLSRQEKMQVAGKAYALPNGRLRDKLYGMVGLITANQFWFCWSLSDKELKDYYQTKRSLTYSPPSVLMFQL